MTGVNGSDFGTEVTVTPPQVAWLRTHPFHQTSALVPRPSARSANQPSASESLSRRPICRRDANVPPSSPKNPPQIDPAHIQSPKFRNYILPIVNGLAPSQPDLRPPHPYNLFE